MVGYLAQRLVQAVVTLFFVALVTFALMHAVPGGPFEALAGERGLSPRLLEAQEAYYGLDQPVAKQFAHYLGYLLRGDLGVSFAQRGVPVTELLLERLRPSLILGAMASVLVVGIGLPMGVLTAVRRDGALDYAALAVSTLLGAVPSFVLAFVLLLVFAVWLDVVDVRLGRDFGDGFGSLRNGVLPAVALGAPATALLMRLTRGAMLDVLAMEYMRTARAKGLSERAVYVRHGLRNALIPVLTLLGPVAAGLVTGSIVVEEIFGVAGIGSASVTAVQQRDYGVIMGATLLYASAIVLANLAVDLAYPLVDPRVKRP